MGLENKLQSINRIANNTIWNGIEHAVDLYNQAYEKYPRITSYLSTAIGTVGGDAIAKRFAEGEDVKLRDVAITGAASIYQAYLYPKLIPLAEKIADLPTVEKAFKKLKINKQWAKAIILTLSFFPLNMFYWGILSVKNKTPINLKTMLSGARAITEVSIPYTGVDYLVANKLKRRYALPVWSAAELGWNIYVALKNYITKNLFIG